MASGAYSVEADALQVAVRKECSEEEADDVVREEAREDATCRA